MQKGGKTRSEVRKRKRKETTTKEQTAYQRRLQSRVHPVGEHLYTHSKTFPSPRDPLHSQGTPMQIRTYFIKRSKKKQCKPRQTSIQPMESYQSIRRSQIVVSQQQSSILLCDLLQFSRRIFRPIDENHTFSSSPRNI